MTEFANDVLAVVGGLRAGEVLTYAEVAAEAGHPGAARAVGRVLAHGGATSGWWRVVGAGGQLVSPQADRQAELLGNERIDVAGHRILGWRDAGVRSIT